MEAPHPLSHTRAAWLPARVVARLGRPRLAAAVLGLLMLAGCVRPDPAGEGAGAAVESAGAGGGAAAALATLPPTPTAAVAGVRPPTPPIFPSPTAPAESDGPIVTPPAVYAGTPTPDPTRAESESAGAQYGSHAVAAGETLGLIAQLYGTTIDELVAINNLGNADVLAIGQIVLVPAAERLIGPSHKLIPDSELVYGPSAADFNLDAFIAGRGGYLARYQEEVEGRLLSGAQVVQLVADRYSVNPRLLLAVLEHRSRWVTGLAPVDDGYPMGYVRTAYEGLYMQLGWAANLLNLGYYGRAEGGLSSFDIAAGQQVAFAPDINDGTAGVQLFLAAHPDTTYDLWLAEVAPEGFVATYERLFGNPFAYTFDPLWPADLQSPAFTLPWPAGETWYFTGGPHGGWASGAAWAAIDFAPAHEQLGCYVSDAWVVAMAPGLVIRSDFGAVVVDLDGDGFAGTGWAIVYMHLETRDRVAAGARVETGDRLGHPSCEGGFSNGTHVHIARTYNGRWVAADGALPFVMSGWVSQGLGREYDGYLVRGDVVKEAYEGREEINAVTAD